MKIYYETINFIDINIFEGIIKTEYLKYLIYNEKYYPLNNNFYNFFRILFNMRNTFEYEFNILI